MMLDLPRRHDEIVLRSALDAQGAVPRRRAARSSPRPPRACPRGSAAIRNWDYRYCWLRDAAMTAQTLLGSARCTRPRASCAGSTGVLDAPAVRPSGCTRSTRCDGQRAGLRGGHRHADRLRRQPAGAGRQRRQGQVQLDVFGPVADLIHDLASTRAGRRRRPSCELLENLVVAVDAPLARTRPRHLGDPRPHRCTTCTPR